MRIIKVNEKQWNIIHSKNNMNNGYDVCVLSKAYMCTIYFFKRLCAQSINVSNIQMLESIRINTAYSS